MSTDQSQLTESAQKLASWVAVLAVVVGVMVLVGWAFDIAVLKSVMPEWVSMKANTAVGFILIGIALLLIARPPAIFNQRLSTLYFHIALLCGLLAGLIGLLSLGEYVFDWDPDIDRWLFREPANAVGTSHSGRMAPETALGFVTLAAALWIAGASRKTRWTILASASLGLLVTSLALASLLSYLTPGLGPFGWFGLTIMSIHTAALFAMLGMAVIAISWRQDVMPWSLSNSTTAAFACGMALLVLIGFNTNRSQFMLAEVDRKIAYSEAVLGVIKSILIETISANAYIRGYVVTGDEQFRIRYLDAQAISHEKLDELRKLDTGNPNQQQKFARIEAQVKAEFQWYRQVIIAKRAVTTDSASYNMIRHGEDLLDNLRITFNQIERDDQHLIQQLKRESESVSRLSYLIISTGTLASLLIFLIVIFRLNFAVNERKQAEDSLGASREDLHRLLNSMAEGAYGVDLNGDCTFVNRAFLQILGYRNESELLGKHMHELIHHAHPDGSFYPESKCSVYRAYRNSESSIVSDEVFWRKDGIAIPVEYRAHPIVADGELVGAIVTFIDITERKKAVAALREKEMLLSESQRIAHIGSWRFELTGQLIWSDETYRIYGVSPDTFIPNVESLLNRIYPDDRLAMQAWLGDCLAGKKPDALEFRITRSDGKVRILNGFGELKYDEFKRPGHLTGIVHDITERKKVDTKLAEQLEELRRWHDNTMGREGRVLDLKHEVNELLSQTGKHPRYPSAESQDQTEEKS